MLGGNGAETASSLGLGRSGGGGTIGRGLDLSSCSLAGKGRNDTGEGEERDGRKLNWGMHFDG